MVYAPAGQLTTSLPATVHAIRDTWECFVRKQSQVVLMIMLLAYTKGVYLLKFSLYHYICDRVCNNRSYLHIQFYDT